MPYASSDDLPEPIRAHLPPHAREIFRSAFNRAWQTYVARDPEHLEQIAFRIAWAAVKKRYYKMGATWVALGPPLAGE